MVVGIVLLSLVINLGIAVVTAQKAERGTQQWTIHVDTSTFETSSEIHVIDTTGVCLYYVVATVAITAVPKTQLPQGAGCQ